MDKAIYEEKLSSDLNLAIKMICDEMIESPISILLCGGYGRGEGSWFFQKGILRPYNDYDFAIITDNPLSTEKTNQLRKKIADEVGIKWIDIDFYSLQAISCLKPSIHNYDLAFGSRVIYGDPRIKEKIKKISSEEISKSDIIILYKTRIWTFLGSWAGDFHRLNEEEGCFFRYQMAKAVLAACDMILIKEKRYESSYINRANICMDIFENDIEKKNLIKFAITEKLTPLYKQMEKEEMIDLYERCKSFFIFAFKNSLGTEAMFYLNPLMTCLKEKYSFLNLLRIFKHMFSGNVAIITKPCDVFLAQNYVFHSINNKTSYIKKANRIMKRWKYCKQKSQDLFRVKDVVAFARNND